MGEINYPIYSDGQRELLPSADAHLFQDKAAHLLGRKVTGFLAGDTCP